MGGWGCATFTNASVSSLRNKFSTKEVVGESVTAGGVKFRWVVRMKELQRARITPDDPRYPARLRQRLGADAPPELTALSNLDLLSQLMTALFCSARCPGKLILRTYDQAVQWRDAGHCVGSGFHSPVEK